MGYCHFLKIESQYSRLYCGTQQAEQAHNRLSRHTTGCIVAHSRLYCGTQQAEQAHSRLSRHTTGCIVAHNRLSRHTAG